MAAPFKGEKVKGGKGEKMAAPPILLTCYLSMTSATVSANERVRFVGLITRNSSKSCQTCLTSPTSLTSLTSLTNLTCPISLTSLTSLTRRTRRAR